MNSGMDILIYLGLIFVFIVLMAIQITSKRMKNNNGDCYGGGFIQREYCY